MIHLTQENIKSIESETAQFLEVLRKAANGDTIHGEFGLEESVALTLIVESPVTRKEVHEDLNLTIIHREAPFTPNTFRGRTICGCIFRTPFIGDALTDLRASMRYCVNNEVPTHIS